MYNIAILGYGVVGSGVVEIIRKNNTGIKSRAGKSIVIKKILDIRDFSQDPNRGLFTKDPDEIFNDDSINLVVETIGGNGVAYEFTKRALSAGKSVVTSNKELVASHGPELLALAAEKGAFYLFEASVGGGIPIIRPLSNCLAANEISGIAGILNGTTNYILTAMKKDGKPFDDALSEAQHMGYAESNPSSDIDGHDAARKIAILSSIAYNCFVDYRDIETEGIRSVTPDDFYFADLLGGTIKLIAESRRVDQSIHARVAPVILDKSNPLSNVDDVFNAIMIDGDAVGNTMFYGKGAGKLPTASAVVADVMDVMKKGKHMHAPNPWPTDTKGRLLDNSRLQARFYVRLDNAGDNEKLRPLIKREFGNVQILERMDKPGQIAFITSEETESKIRNQARSLVSAGFSVSNMLRIKG